MFVRSGLGFIEINADDCTDVANAECLPARSRKLFYRAMAYLVTVRDLMLAGF